LALLAAGAELWLFSDFEGLAFAGFLRNTGFWISLKHGVWILIWILDFLCTWGLRFGF